jgi:hypothetical protein
MENIKSLQESKERKVGQIIRIEQEQLTKIWIRWFVGPWKRH